MRLPAEGTQDMDKEMLYGSCQQLPPHATTSRAGMKGETEAGSEVICPRLENVGSRMHVLRGKTELFTWLTQAGFNSVSHPSL